MNSIPFTANNLMTKNIYQKRIRVMNGRMIPAFFSWLCFPVKAANKYLNTVPVREKYDILKRRTVHDHNIFQASKAVMCQKLEEIM